MNKTMLPLSLLQEPFRFGSRANKIMKSYEPKETTIAIAKLEE